MRWPRRRGPGAIEFAPLAAACAAIALTAAPLANRLATWVVVLVYGAIAVRLCLNDRSQRLPSMPMKLVLLGLGTLGVTGTFGGLASMESRLSILLLLIALKLLETSTVRDFQVLTLLGIFMALCDLFYSQGILMWGLVVAAFLLLTGALVRLHVRGGTRGLPRSLRTAGVIMLQALPVTVLLFVFFPRGYQGLQIPFARSILGTPGMADRMAPGTVASLVLSNAIAFYVNFPDGDMPAIPGMYWRGMVLWDGDGLNWAVRRGLSREPRGNAQLGGAAIRQHVSLAPSGNRFLFGLDRPERVDKDAEIQPGRTWLATRPIFSTFHYNVVSRPESREELLPRDHYNFATAKPQRLSPEVAALGEEWRREAGGDDAAIIERGMRYFRENQFNYTLDPGRYTTNTIDEFLFKRRAGFCEHYAAAFTTLMRAAGLPARIVIGYRGGEYNTVGKFLQVRQSDAHAWCEVWLRDRGWQRVDPTDAIAPERVSAALSPRMQSLAADAAPDSHGATVDSRLQRMLRTASLAWDSVSYHWDLHVLTYDDANQRAFLSLMGFEDSAVTVVWVIVAISLLLAAVALWLRRPARFRGDAVSRAYDVFCRRLAAAGVAREPWEGPVGFTERAAGVLPAHAATLRAIGALFARFRYSPHPPAAAEIQAALRQLPQGARLSEPPARASLAPSAPP